jgi:hypothetical protein
MSWRRTTSPEKSISKSGWESLKSRKTTGMTPSQSSVGARSSLSINCPGFKPDTELDGVPGAFGVPVLGAPEVEPTVLSPDEPPAEQPTAKHPSAIP